MYSSCQVLVPDLGNGKDSCSSWQYGHKRSDASMAAAIEKEAQARALVESAIDEAS